MTWSLADIPDQQGKVAVITGANGGLGLETARALALAGAKVIMAVRNLEKARLARDSIVSQHPRALLELQPLDLTSLASTRSAAADLLERHSQIDILVNNAGLMGIPQDHTEDGFEMQFGVNHLGHFALTAQLMPALRRSLHARVVAISSFGRHYRGRFDPTDPPLRGAYDPWRAYGQSKMANLRFALELDRRARRAGLPLASLAVHPGLSYTDLYSNSVRRSAGGRSQRLGQKWGRRLGTSRAQGALSQIRAATDPTAEGGHFYRPLWLTAGPPVRFPLMPWTRRSRQNQLMWSVSEDLTGVRFVV